MTAPRAMPLRAHIVQAPCLVASLDVARIAIVISTLATTSSTETSGHAHWLTTTCANGVKGTSKSTRTSWNVLFACLLCIQPVLLSTIRVLMDGIRRNNHNWEPWRTGAASSRRSTPGNQAKAEAIFQTFQSDYEKYQASLKAFNEGDARVKYPQSPGMPGATFGSVP